MCSTDSSSQGAIPATVDRMSWRWGKLELPAADTQETVATELANFLAEMMARSGQDSVIGPDGVKYDIEIGVRLIQVM